MREIKFRAWNKVQEKMFTVEGLDFVYEPPAILRLNHEMPNIKVVDYWLHDEDFVLMQFTGLKDKNGKDIYEGDIVYLDFKSEILGKGKGEIRFENGTFGIQFDTNFWPFLSNPDVKIYEVIGNCFENPELLNGK